MSGMDKYQVEEPQNSKFEDFKDWLYYNYDWMIIIAVFLIALVGLTLGGNAFYKHNTHQKCDSFGQLANRETKYVEYTYWSADCLVPQAEGKWISAYNLRGE